MERSALWRYLSFAAIVVLLWTSCSESQTTDIELTDAQGKNKASLAVELAYTPGTRQIGLMYRKELAENRGMLFIFPNEAPRSFWMKNTYISLDIIYFDKNFKLVSIVHSAKPLTKSPQLSKKPATYALEVVSGLAKKWGLQEGDILSVDGTLPIPK